MTIKVSQDQIKIRIKKIRQIVSETLKKRWVRIIASLLFFPLASYSLLSIANHDPTAIYYEGVFQRGSEVNWTGSVFRVNNVMTLPTWASVPLITGKRIYLRSCNSSDELSLAFSALPDTIKDWGISSSSQPHISPSFRAQSVEFSSVSIMTLILWALPGFSGVLKFHHEGSVSFSIRDSYTPYIAQLIGKPNELFQLFLNQDSKESRKLHYEAKFGEFPTVTLLTDPPRYPKTEGMVGVLIQGGEVDPYAGGCDEKDSFFMITSLNLQDLDSPSGVSTNLNLSIKSVTLKGFRNSVVTLAGRVYPIASSDRLEVVFNENSPGQLQIEIRQAGPSSVNINGHAIIVKQNETNLLPANIENWPWYWQSIVWALLGLLLPIVFPRLSELLNSINK